MSNSSRILSGKNRRRLTDLYMVGQELSFTDDDLEDSEPIVIWLNKISPIQQRDAADNATKVRAGILSIKNAPSASAERLIYEDQIYDLGLDERTLQIEFLATNKLQEAETSNEERLAAEDEWADDQYLRSLQEAWNDGAMEIWTSNPDGEDAETKEAVRIYDELKRFADQVTKASEDDRENILAEYEHYSDEEIFKQTVDRIIESEADFAWMNEFACWQVFYAVRDPEDHSERYFENRDEVGYLDNRILTEIVREYRDMTVEGVEGKD
jgi:hypothetical protein